MPYIIIASISIIVIVAGIVIIKKSQSEEKKYYEAAYRMVKEDYLTSSLKKSDSSANGYVVNLKMVYLKLCSWPKQGYVFNPEKAITIGRDKMTNAICIPYPTISLNHCKIILYKGEIYLQDMNSSNGTIVQKGMKKYYISSGESIMLDNKDKIILGETILRIVIFEFQTMRK